MMETNHEMQLPEVVMVHPGLEDDPVHKQGEIGVITAAIVNSDEFFVGFDDSEVGLYSADALLALRNTEEISAYLLHNSLGLDELDLRPLKNIDFLLYAGGGPEARTSLEIVQQHPNLLPIATIGLNEMLGLDQSRGMKR